MAAVVPLFMWEDIKNGVHYAKKRWMDRMVRKVIITLSIIILEKVADMAYTIHQESSRRAC